MRFAAELIDKIRDANDIVEIISPYTELKGNGHRLMGRCPFPDHNDKSPSFSVTREQQLYFCYGCKKGGNVFTFLETFNGLSFPEAIEFLARRASIALPEKSEPGAPTIQREKKDLLLKVNRLAAVFYHQQLKAESISASESPLRSYLKKRGLKAETIEKFRLGFASSDWRGLVSELTTKRVPMRLAENLGLVKLKRDARPDADDSHFDLFRDRLMFPIFSSSGEVIGFGGRTLDPDGTPKYLNSSDSALFNKSRVLYGIHEAGRFIRAEDRAIVVEGYMDAIALSSSGLRNVVAILGTAFTPEHAKILKRYTLNVVMLLDGDEAGMAGAERSLPILLEAGLMPKGLVLPDEMDPDEFVRAHGPQKLTMEISRAPELFSLLLTRRWLTDYRGSASEKVRVVEQASAALIRAENQQLLELYLLDLSRQLDVDIGWVRRALVTAAKEKRPEAKSESPASTGALAVTSAAIDSTPDRISLKGAPKEEVFVLSLLVLQEHLMKDLMEAGPDEVALLLSNAGVRGALRMAVERYHSRPESFSSLAAALGSEVDEPSSLNAAFGLLSSVHPEKVEDVSRKLMTDYMNSIRMRILKKQGNILASQLKEDPNPEALQRFMTISRNRIRVGKDSP